VQAVVAGVDMVLTAGPTGSIADTDRASTRAYASLLAATRSGRISSARVQAAYRRVTLMKAQSR
jgi:beta-glucosidase-like glycosyl hydrolase